MTDLAQQIVSSLALGGFYALLALGLALVFSVLNMINFAHGELITVSGYAMLGLHSLGASWGVLVIGGIVAGGVTALLMERIAFRPVRDSAPTTMLLTSFGLAIVIQSLLASIISARPQAVPQPAWLNRGFHIGDVAVQWHELLTIVLTGTALLGLLVFLQRSFLGTAVRAAAADSDASRLMGINADRVIAAVFAISGVLAGLAAVSYLARVGSVDPWMGLTPLLFAFVAAVIGGIGSLKGAVAGGLAVGFVEVALRTWLPNDMTSFTPALLFLAVAVLLAVRPRGMFGAEGAVRV